MKDLISCFSEHAVRISDVGCSGGGGANAAAEAGGPGRAAVTAVTTVYRSRLAASGKDLLIDVTWSRSPDGPALSVAVHEPAASPRRRGAPGDAAAAMTRHPRRKGSGTFTTGDGRVVGVFWDYAAARYDDDDDGRAGRPEPASGFYVAVVADAEFVLLLGDLSRGYAERLHPRGGVPPTAAGSSSSSSSRVARRRERFVGGRGCWSTRARFSESGADHEIAVSLVDGGDAEGWVAVDGRRVVRLRRVRWNFRGSHTIFVDGGAPVDVTWNLHGWLFRAGAADPHASSSHCAVFTFQTRGVSDTRLWTEDDDDYYYNDVGERKKPGGGGTSGQGFCLLIQGYRGFSSKST